MSAIWPKWYHSNMPAIGKMDYPAGALLTQLDKILVGTGFDATTLDSLVVSGGIATGTYSGGQPFLAYQVIDISGITDETSLNTEHRVISAGATTFTFDATGISDGTLTGTIVAKTPSLGWEIVYTATNKRVYRSTDLAATGCLLRVDDGQAYYAKTNGFGAMTDVDTGTDQFPASTAYVAFNKVNSTTKRDFCVVGDARFFWYDTLYSADTAAGAQACAFGDIVSWNVVAPQWDCVLYGYGAQGGAAYLHYMNQTYLAYGHTPRQYDGTAWPSTPRQFTRCNAFPLSTYSTYTPYPANPTAGIPVSRPTICQEYQGLLRGLWPGLGSIGCDAAASLTPFQLLDVTEFAHKLMMFPTQSYYVAIDLGPWR